MPLPWQIAAVLNDYHHHHSISGGGVTTATWNPSDKDANITLSGSNLIATQGGGTNTSVRATASASSGKKYFEATITAASGFNNNRFGVAKATESLTSSAGETAASATFNQSSGNIRCNATNILTAVTYATGDVIGFAIDIDTVKIWVRKNGGNWNNDVIGNQDPANGIGGADCTAAGLSGAALFPIFCGNFSGDQCTANFGGSAYSNAAPSGFGNW